MEKFITNTEKRENTFLKWEIIQIFFSFLSFKRKTTTRNCFEEFFDFKRFLLTIFFSSKDCFEKLYSSNIFLQNVLEWSPTNSFCSSDDIHYSTDGKMETFLFFRLHFFKNNYFSFILHLIFCHPNQFFSLRVSMQITIISTDQY